MDLEIAAYKQGKPYANFFQNPNDGPVPRRRPAFSSLDKQPTNLEKVVRRLRYSTWKRQESHNKQLQHFINRENYSQNQTWQAEHDRLLGSTDVPAGLQPFVNQRLESLKNVMI